MTQRNFIYFPDTRAPSLKDAKWATEIQVKTSDNLTLSAWWKPPATPDKPTIVFFHGNGGHIGWRISKAIPYIRQGYGLLFAEYRGYGGNEGSPSEKGLYKDGRAYMEWLLDDKKIPASQLVLYGESLGSGVAIQMATEFSHKMLILDVPFNNLTDTAKSHFFYIPFLEYFVREQYRNDEKIATLSTPLLIGLAEEDRVVPLHLGEALFQVSNEPKTLKRYTGADHMGIYNKGFALDVIDFIETHID